jgi:RHS repeat-associated protein
MWKSTVAALALVLGWPVGAAGQTEQIEYYHVDAVGSVRAVTDVHGNVVRRHDYYPFGEEAAPTAAEDPLRFAGKERDVETGLDYFGARYYASRTGRFTTVDPVVPLDAALRDPQLWNRYAYVRNNPLRYTDPDGRCIWDLCIGESAAAWAAGAAATALTVWMLSPEGHARTQAVVEATGTAITRTGELLANSFAQFAAANEPFAREWAKLGHLKGHLTPSDLEGARRDLAGDPVIGPGGRAFQHLKEVQDAQRGLQNLIEQLKARIGSGKLSQQELEEAQRLLGEASRTLDRTEQLVPRQ